MITLCFHCQEEMPNCMPDENDHLICQNCFDLIVRTRHLADKERRERIESVWQEQDERSQRDGGYKVQPINMRIPQVGEK